MPSTKLSVAFYNLENLFDTQRDTHILDGDFTASGKLHWDASRYESKLKVLSGIISRIGVYETKKSPILIGLAEVENKKVLNDLLDQPELMDEGYDYVHFNSPDERGIEVALMYKTDDFEVIHAEPIPLQIKNEHGQRDYTRDILYVRGRLKGLNVHVLVNHWPSRGEGEILSRPKRRQAATQLRAKVDAILADDQDARLLIMGDFNDNPNSASVKKDLVKNDLYNPMVFLLTRHEGSLSHKFEWFLFDQIIVSNNWMKNYDNALVYDQSAIFAPEDLKEAEGRFKETPFRTYAGDNYLGGPSDHFPVYVVFEVKEV